LSEALKSAESHIDELQKTVDTARGNLGDRMKEIEQEEA